MEFVKVACDTHIPWDDKESIQEILLDLEKEQNTKGSFKYRNQKEYFACQTSSSVTLTFRLVEEILGFPLCLSARKYRYFWYEKRIGGRGIAYAWLSEGYKLEKLDLDNEKLRFVRSRFMEGKAPFKIPEAITKAKLPENAVYEIEQFMKHIVKKYRL